MKKLLVFISLFIMSFTCKPGNVVVFGEAKSYAGNQITVMHHSNSFTYTEKRITDFTVNQNGKFSFEFQLDETMLIFFHLGAYKAFLYVEPDRKYEIKLPPKQELTPAQKLNPFFKPEELMLGVLHAKPNELNLLIRQFDDQLDAFVHQNFHRIYRQKEKSPGKIFSKQINKEFEQVKHNFFSNYMEYRLGFLEFLSAPENFIAIENKYFKHRKILTNNPAYISLYKKQYGNFFDGYFKQKETKNLSKALLSKNTYGEISKLMQKYPAYQDIRLRNLIIATSVFDAYGRNFIAKNKALSILNAVLNASETAYTKEFCKNLLAEMTKLRENSPAPYFKINNIALSDYKGKYLYLNFCHTQSHVCVQDFKEMEKLKQQFGQHVAFLSIVCDESKNPSFSYDEYSWKFVPLSNQSNLLENYNLVAFPSYFLIDPQGNIVKAPAQGPRENIHLEFLRIMRDAVRNANQKEK